MGIDTVRITVEFHGENEVILCRETTMTFEEMQALMVFFGKLRLGEIPTPVCCSSINKVYRVLADVSQSVDEPTGTAL